MSLHTKLSLFIGLTALFFAPVQDGFSMGEVVDDEAARGEVLVASPDERVRVQFSLAQRDDQASVPVYSVSFRDKLLLRESAMGLELAPAGPMGPLQVLGVERRTSDTTYAVFPGKTNAARDHYNEAVVSLREIEGARRIFSIVFRAYDDGAAFRYEVPEQPALEDFTVADERSEFVFEGNPVAWALPAPYFGTPYEFYYKPQPVKAVPAGQLLCLPLLLQYPDKTSLAITEAHLHDYAGMYLTPLRGTSGSLVSRLSKLPGYEGVRVRSTLPHVTPWRVLMIGDSLGPLVESNLVNNLNPPSVIADTSWIKPGKTTFPWWNGFALGDEVNFKGGLNTETAKHYIDFCAEAGIEKHSLDGVDDVAWYGGPLRPYRGADITTTTLPGLDLPGVISYAKSKGVSLRLWMAWEAARLHMHRAFPLYEKWGIEGVMLDFFDRDDQDVVNFIHEAVALAAKHHLTVTLHNVYKPTGLNRTYPNLMTYEAVLNLEFNKWDPKASTPEHELIVPFTRMLAGPLDYHSGGFRHVSQEDFKPQDVAPLVMGTRARELARYVVYEGYLPMTADFPAAYRGEPGLDVMAGIPTTWDETRLLDGEVGKFITIARRSGDTWYVGSMVGSTERELDIPLAILGEGEFVASAYADDMSPGAALSSLEATTTTVKATDKITARLKPAGGHLLVIRKQ
jgi:alpha-glucosidase